MRAERPHYDRGRRNCRADGYYGQTDRSGHLTLSELQPREEISKDGGSASFTVVSNRDWTAESDQKWLTLTSHPVPRRTIP